MTFTNHFHVESLCILMTQFLVFGDSVYELEIMTNAFIYIIFY